MNQTKILEIGTEGGSLSFYRVEQNGEVRYQAGSSGKSFSSASEAFQSYSKNQNALLHFYPVQIIDEYIDDLMPILQTEINQYGREDFLNLGTWEEILQRKLQPKRNKQIQTFTVYDVIVMKNYSYNEYSDYRTLDSEMITYNYEPNSKKLIDGIGSVEANTFIIRDEDSTIKGIFPLERHEVYVSGEK